MNGEMRAPLSSQVISAIARREITIALRRRLVKLLFLINLVPPIVMGVILIVNMAVRQAGLDLGWDPLRQLFQIQTGPVLLLALGIGTPLVARDRNEDVLFLYATRPVTPWSYTLGKMMAVVFPAVAVLVVPGILIAVLRQGLMQEFGLIDSLVLLGKVLVVSTFMAWGYAGVTVGSSATTKKARWALLLTFLCFTIPAAAAEIIWGSGGYALDARHAVEHLLTALFESDFVRYGVAGAFTLAAWGGLGAFVTAARVRKEMTP
jgi:ABC-type transport system involved in multi-copper enzyme maturation permease subunit